MIRLRSGRTMALLGSPADGFVYRVLAGADPFADASWQPWPAARVTKEWEEPRATGGPRGAFVMYGVHILDQVYGAAPQVVRKFNGRRWGRPRGLFYEVTANTSRRGARPGRQGPPARGDRRLRGQRATGSCIAYARTSRKRWFTPRRLRPPDAQGRREARPRAAGRRRPGRGVVTWSTTGTPRRGARAVVASPAAASPARASTAAVAARRTRADTAARRYRGSRGAMIRYALSPRPSRSRSSDCIGSSAVSSFTRSSR